MQPTTTYPPLTLMAMTMSCIKDDKRAHRASLSNSSNDDASDGYVIALVYDNDDGNEYGDEDGNDDGDGHGDGYDNGDDDECISSYDKRAHRASLPNSGRAAPPSSLYTPGPPYIS